MFTLVVQIDEKLNRQPLLILVCCFILGILFQDYFSFKQNCIFIVAIFCFFIAICTLIKSFLISRIYSVILGVFFFGLGICVHYLNSPEASPVFLNPNQDIVFKISKKLNSTEKNKKYEGIVEVDQRNFSSVILIPKESKELDFKHYYKAKAYLAEAQSPEFDFQFDYARYLSRKNIHYQCYINDGISSSLRNDLTLGEKIRQSRLEVLQNINQSKMSSKSQEFLKGIILADRSGIDSETLQDFNKAGLVHFLAISGTHIVIIFGLLYYVLMRFLPLRFRKGVIILSLIFIWIFAVFIGFGNSVVRSCIMLSVYFIYVLLQRKPDLLHSLALSAFIILVIDSQQFFDVGFQLSFLAVLGIYWLNQPILKLLPKPNNFFKKIFFNTISISFSAQIATMPMVLCYFHQFSAVSIIANLFIIPFSEVIIVFSLLMTVLLAMKIDFWMFDMIYDFIIDVLLKSIHWFAKFESLFFENIPMNWWEAGVLFVIVYLLRFVVIKLNIKNFTQFTIAVFLFFILRISFSIFEESNNEILVHHYKKKNVLSVKSGADVCFYIQNFEDQMKIQQYIIYPYCTSRRVKNVLIKKLPDNTGKVVFNKKVYELK